MMTIEEKAKAYDEALGRAKKEWIENLDNCYKNYREHLEIIFPELKESDWLEKQSYTKKDIDDAYLKGVTDTKNEMEKQYEANYQIRKDIATFIFNYRGDIKDRAKWMDYLGIKVSFAEKQSEQKHCMIQWKGDNLKEVIDFTGKDKNFEKWFKSFEEYEKYVQEHDGIFKLFNTDGSHYEIPVGAWIVKTPDGYNVASKAIFRQKSVDTPKFKVGDWIVSNFNTVCYVESINEKNYYLQLTNGFHERMSINYVDRNFHLWTIADAKDGDVLTSIMLTSISFHSNCTFIFNGLDNWKFDAPNGDRAVATGYCCLSASADNMEFGIKGPDCIEVDTVKPATKEQRDFLFEKMYEAGYEWDAEKKELKKIEQNPTWSIEDEEIIKNILSVLDVQVCWNGATGKKENPYQKEIDWLKSLKERRVWRPNDKQMNALDSTLQYSQVSHNSFEYLNSLFNDLKKLKG